MKHVKFFITDVIRQRNTKEENPVFIVRFKTYFEYNGYLRCNVYTARTSPNAMFTYRLSTFNNGRKAVYRIDTHETPTGRIIIDNIEF